MEQSLEAVGRNWKAVLIFFMIIFKFKCVFHMKIFDILCHGPGPATSFVMLKSMGTFHTKIVTEVKLGTCNSLLFQTIFSKYVIKLGKLVLPF